MLPLSQAESSTSIDQIEAEIRRFLADKEPEVICISGRWGVGKTFAWKFFLKRAQETQSIALSRYSYISLFGLNSLDDLKYSIFENSVQSSSIIVEPSLDTLMSNTSAVAERLGKRSLWFLQQLPKVKSYVGGLGPVWFMSVKEMIVCIDDIERHGKDLRVRDILGLVSVLKEQKKCKVILILNDEALQKDSDKEDFNALLEKVVDVFLKFQPSAEECAMIALPDGAEITKMLAEDCIALGISNIRVIRRLERAVRHVAKLLARFDQEVLRGVVHSVALLGWSIYEPNRAPSEEYLRARLPRAFSSKPNEQQPEREEKWDKILEEYNFVALDEFDEALLQGLNRGFFDRALIEQHAAALDERVQSSRAEGLIRESWVPFHDCFDDNQEQVIESIYTASIVNIKYLSVLDLNNVTKILKTLGSTEKAAAVIKAYVDARREKPQVFNLDNFPFRNRIDDPDVIEAFRANRVEPLEKRDPVEILLGFARSGTWLGSDISVLAELNVEEYVRIFKTVRGPDLRLIVGACLEFARIGNPTPGMTEILTRARDALIRIGQESPLNALRVESNGISLAQVIVDRVCEETESA